jgi:hypothetical protein
MASDKQIVANRANALKSRGPRSAGGKARASRNAIRHGLAANIWKEASAVSSIEGLMQLFRAGGHSEQNARLAAVAEFQTRSIRIVRSRIGKQLCEAADGCAPDGSLVKDLMRLQSIDRYEKRVSSRKKRVFRQMQRETSPT